MFITFDIEVGFILSSKGGGRGVFCSCRASYSQTHILAILLLEFVVVSKYLFFQIFWHFGFHNQRSCLFANLLEFFNILWIEIGKKFSKRFPKIVAIKIVAIGRGSDCKTVWHIDAKWS